MTLLARHLLSDRDVLFVSFTRQYPGWLFPGRSDLDPSREPITTGAEYILDPVNPLSWRRSLQRISDWRPEVVVIPWWVPYWAPAWSVLGRRVKHLPGSPMLLFICHNIFPHESGRLDRAAARIALAPGDGFVVHSEADAVKLKELHPSSRIRITPHPSYQELITVDRAPLPVPVPADKPLLLFCGFVRPYKGLDILIRALPAVLAKQPVHLLVAGEFWEGGAGIQRLIKDLDLKADVTIIDQYLPNELLATCLDRADVVVLPYRSATQSGVVQLAFGSNKPVITTDVGGLAEAVRHRETGLIVPPEDPDSLAGAIISFFEEDLGPIFENNIRRDSERFGWQRLIEQLEALANPDDEG